MTRSSDPLVARHSVLLDGRRRTFTVAGPVTAATARPLVLVFHGSKQDADSHRRFTGDALLPLAADGVAVIAYLDGFGGNWNDARRESPFPARTHAIDDVAFTRAVVDRLEASHGIDTARVAMVGYSNGGQMVLRLLHEEPQLVAAAVIVAATMPAPENFLIDDGAPPARSTPITLVHGTADRIVPFTGGTMSRWAQKLFKVGGRTLSARETAAYLATRNGLFGPPEVRTLPTRAASDGRTTVIRARHSGAGAPAVTLFEVLGGGHTIPGPHRSPRLMGRTTADIALVDLVAEAVSLT